MVAKEQNQDMLITLTSDIVTAHVGNDVTPSFPPAGIRAGRLFCA